jgi:hypothetical protein
VPVVVTTSITVSTELAPLKLTVKTAAVPSFTDGLEMLTVGCALISLIVAVPLAVVLAVDPELTVPVKVKLSAGSLMASVSVGTFTVALVLPAGMVTIVVTAV